MTTRDRLTTGFRVFSADGYPIGSVARIGYTHFRCDSGFLGMGPHLYFPYADVERIENDCLYLDVSRDHIDVLQFCRVPAGWS